MKGKMCSLYLLHDIKTTKSGNVDTGLHLETYQKNCAMKQK